MKQIRESYTMKPSLLKGGKPINDAYSQRTRIEQKKAEKVLAKMKVRYDTETMKKKQPKEQIMKPYYDCMIEAAYMIKSFGLVLEITATDETGNIVTHQFKDPKQVLGVYGLEGLKLYVSNPEQLDNSIAPTKPFFTPKYEEVSNG